MGLYIWYINKQREENTMFGFRRTIGGLEKKWKELPFVRW